MDNFTFTNITKIYEMLADEESKEIYLAKLNFLISEDYKYLRGVIEKYLPELTRYNKEKNMQLRELLPVDRKIIFYGAGDDAKANFYHWEQENQRVIGFCDRDIEKQKNGCNGYPVISPEELLKRKDVSVVISTHKGFSEIKRFLLESGFPAENIYNMAEYVFWGEPDQYFNPNFMYFDEEEIFIDAGCLNFSSSIQLSEYCRNLKKVYAFEPDRSNYQNCLDLKAKLDKTEVVLLPYGTWSKKGTLRFSATKDGASHVSETGDVSIDVIPIDDAVDPKDKITFIKMDVEGSELESLKGAKRTIQKNKPKLAICIYHKPEDMIDIPLYIKDLVPEYKLYVRHHSNAARETVLYAMP